MLFTMLSNQSVGVSVSPINALEQPSPATLSNVVFSSSDETIFTVAPDPADPNGAIVTGVAPGNAILVCSATATEPDGTSNPISGAVTITLTERVAPAAGLEFTFGTPVDQGGSTLRRRVGITTRR